MTVPVLYAPVFDPGAARQEQILGHGLTLAEIIAQTVPGAGAVDLAWLRGRLRVWLITDTGKARVDPAYWHRVRPKPGTRVVIRAVPGRDTLRTVLLTVVSIAAYQFAPYLALSIPGLGAAGYAAATAAIAVGLNLAGSALVNALVPLAPPTNRQSDRPAETYAIHGWRNEARPGQPVPKIFGHLRNAPPFAAGSYSEIVGDDQYVRALFTFGHGPLEVTDIQIGETPLSAFENVETELRAGRAGDLPMTLYPHQVIEETSDIRLLRPLPRDAAGNVTAGDAIAAPVTRFTASDAAQVSVIFSFPRGLFYLDRNGARHPAEVEIRLRQRPETGGAWQEVETLKITANKIEGFFRQHSWDLPARGRWEIEITRMTPEATDQGLANDTTLLALQSIRPEAPINTPVPLSLLAMRIKATHQLSGPLDRVSARVKREALDWDGTQWTPGLPRNPAAAYLAALTSGANTYPAALDEIDLDQLADWHDFCAAKGLSYDRAHDQHESLANGLQAICGAGRASPRHDGTKWGVVIDRPAEIPMDHITPRNSADFQWSRSYLTPPDAFRVAFLDATNDHRPAERLIPWPGHQGEIRVTEAIELPGLTEPDAVWRAARRRQYELIHRLDRYSAVLDGADCNATRGDLVLVSTDVLDRDQIGARVLRVDGPLISIDAAAPMTPGGRYGVQFFTGQSEADPTGILRLVEVEPNPGPNPGPDLGPNPGPEATNLLRLVDATHLPEPGQMLSFGPLDRVSHRLKIRAVEAGEDMVSVLHMVPEAASIDDLTDAEVPPAWNGRVGAPVDLSGLTPGVPRFTAIVSGVSGTGQSGGLRLSITSDPGSAVVAARFRISHRLEGASAWTQTEIPAVAGGAAIPGYAQGDRVQIQARAISGHGTLSDPTEIIPHEIGALDGAIPAALDPAAITVTGGLGHTQIALATGADAALAQIQIYRVPAGAVLDRDAHAASRIATGPQQTLSIVDGDGTRQSLLTGAWTLDPGWSAGTETLTHSPGAAGAASHAMGIETGATYRYGLVVTGQSAGQVTPTLTGGSDTPGAAIPANGQITGAFTAAAGNDAFALVADAAFDGAVAELMLYRQTAASLDPGSYDYVLEPLNSDGIPGPLSGPFPVTIL